MVSKQAFLCSLGSIYLSLLFVFLLMDVYARPANNSALKEKGMDKDENEILPRDHLNGVKMEMDGHLNKDFHQEVFLGKEMEEFDEDSEPRRNRKKLMAIFAKSSPSSLQNINSAETIQEFSPVPDQVRGEPRASSGLVNSRQKSYENSRYYHGSSITGGLVKGAMSFAASAYKALFAGPPVTAQPIVSEDQTAALMSHLFEMGFCDRQLNLRLLKKHNHNILQVVTELLQINNNDWHTHRY